MERADHLGGNLVRVDLTAPFLDSAREILTERITRVLEHPYIEVLLESQVRSVDGFVGNFKTTVRSKTEFGPPVDETFDVGSVIVCTGYKEFDAARITHYGYGKLPNVVTSFELEKMLRAGEVTTKEGKAAAVRGHHPLRGQPQPRVSRLLLARLLHDGAQVRQRDQVGRAGSLRKRHLRRHARLRQGP